MTSAPTKFWSALTRAWPALLAALVALALTSRSAAVADASTVRGYEFFDGRYASFCCQVEGHAAVAPSATGLLRFAPCYEARDSTTGRVCRQEQLFFYPVAVRTDRTFTFDNETRELTIYPR